MRIGFDAHVLDGKNQGTKTLVLRIINALALEHPEHDIIVYSQNIPQDLFVDLPNVHHRVTHYGGSFRHLLLTLPKAHSVDDIDIMVFNFIQSPLIRKSAVLMHDILPLSRPRFFGLPFIVRCWLLFCISSMMAKHLFTISEYSRNEIRSVFPWTRGKSLSVLHIGASFSEQTYLVTQDRHPAKHALHGVRYVLVVGRIELRKNVQLAIDAFVTAAPADVRLIIVGRRESGIIIDTHNDPRINEMSGIDDDELVQLYREASLFLYPSSAEGFGLPLLDAILFGVPTISSNQTSMAEVGSGCVDFFNPDEPDALAWLSRRIARHFGEDPVEAPPEQLRLDKIELYSWRNAAVELVKGIA